MPSFYEFFAGGGMARAGLGDGWNCLFANDIDPKKALSYAANWSGAHLTVSDVGQLTSADLPGHADLAWASFPCQDLSLAGRYAGLRGERSGTFWLFWRLIKTLIDEGRAPTMIVLENVCGALTSHNGEDFAAISGALAGAGYRFGALVMDAVRFVPQSRPRLFVVAIREDRPIGAGLINDDFDPLWRPRNLIGAFQKLPRRLKSSWVSWNLPEPPLRQVVFADLIEDDPKEVGWHSRAETQRLLSLMSAVNIKKVEQAKRNGTRTVGGIYKRTRRDENGNRAQRAEVRFDDIAGCLRTPLGGSSRQFVIVITGRTVRTRLLAPHEAARLMGLPDTYKLPQNYNEAYHLVGDGVAVPAVRFLAAHILEPLLVHGSQRESEAAA